MTLKTSSVKNHPVMNFMRFTLKKQTPLTLLITAFTLLVCPGLPIRYMLEFFDRKYGDYQLCNVFGYFAVFIFAAGLLLMFLLLLVNFSFLFNKKAGDMYQALPLTRNELLFTRAFSSFVAAFFTVTAAFAGLGIVNFLPDVEGIGVAQFITTYLLTVLFLMVSTAFTLIFVVCCGGYFDTFIALGSANLGPLALLAILINFASDRVNGITFNDEMLFNTSPYLFMAGKLYRNTTLNTWYAVPSQKISLLEIILLTVFGIICLIISAKLFAIRKSEKAGEAYAFKFVPFIICLPISMVGGWLIGYILSGSSHFSSLDFWVFFIVGAILCAITYGVITFRGFKTLKKSLISGAISILLMVALIIGSVVIANRAEVYVPNKENIKTIYLDNLYIGDIAFEDDFDIVLDIHSKIVENIENEAGDTAYVENEFMNTIDRMNITYVLKSGKRIERRYWHSDHGHPNLKAPLLRLVQSDSYLSGYAKCFTSVKEFVGITYHEYDEKADKTESKNALLTNEQAKTLFELYKKEMKEADEDIFAESCYGISVQGNVYANVFIPHSFDECWGYLEPMLKDEE